MLTEDIIKSIIKFVSLLSNGVHTRQGNVGEIEIFSRWEFYVVSVKNGYLLKCQGNVREFYNFQFVSNDEKQKTTRAVFLTFWIHTKSF